MNKNYIFLIGEKVKVKDLPGMGWIRGVVSKVTKKSVFIWWHDFLNPIEYFKDEYWLIKTDK